MIWRATGRNRYQLAHEEEGGRVVLDFGKHRGAALDELPVQYLRWLATCGFLPVDLLLRVREVLGEPAAPIPTEALLRWTETATIGEAAEALAGLRRVVTALDARLSAEAEALGPHVDFGDEPGTTGRTWTAEGGRQLAHETATGSVRLDFGKHRGRRLEDLPAEYLTWLARGGGKALLPADLLALAEDELRARERKPEKITCPDVGDVPALLAWAEEAPAGDVGDVASYLRALAVTLTDVLDRRAEEVAGLLS